MELSMVIISYIQKLVDEILFREYVKIKLRKSV